MDTETEKPKEEIEPRNLEKEEAKIIVDELIDGFFSLAREKLKGISPLHQSLVYLRAITFIYVALHKTYIDFGLSNLMKREQRFQESLK